MSQPDPNPKVEEEDPLADLRRPGGGTTTTAARTLEERKAVLLEQIARGRSLRESCDVAAVNRKSVKHWRDTDPAFQEKYDLALEDGADRVREAIRKRGEEGWQEEIYGKDGLLGHRTMYSDKLLLARAQALCPEYRPKLELSATTDAMELARKIRDADMRARATVPPPPAESSGT